MKKLAIVIGRFQINHIEHDKMFNKALDLAEHAVILVGSSMRSRSIDNPFTFEERSEMIKSAFTGNQSYKTFIEPLEDDLYLESKWVSNVKTIVEKYKTQFNIESDDDIILVGSSKDETSYYINSFDYGVYDYLAHNEFNNISATYIRWEWMLGAKIINNVHKNVNKILNDNKLRDMFGKLPSMLKQLPIMDYPVLISNTMLVNGDKVLLTKNYSGYWSLPESHVDLYQDQLKCAIECVGSYATIEKKNYLSHDFMGRRRDPRGDLRTKVFYIPVEPNDVSESTTTKWFTYNEIHEMRDQIFADHYFIIRTMRNKHSIYNNIKGETNYVL